MGGWGEWRGAGDKHSNCSGAGAGVRTCPLGMLCSQLPAGGDAGVSVDFRFHPPNVLPVSTDNLRRGGCTGGDASFLLSSTPMDLTNRRGKCGFFLQNPSYKM